MSVSTARLAILTAAVVLALAAAPAAQACCTPCSGFCNKSNLEAFCCTGIPEPGNACGLTTCREYLFGDRPVDVEKNQTVAPVTRVTPVGGEPGPSPLLDLGPEPTPLVDGCTAETTCSSGHTLSCTGDPGEVCGSNPGWDVFCGSCSLNCTAINAWQACRDSCDAAFTSCLQTCDGTRTGCIHCSENRLDCLIACGSKPATTCSG